MTEEQASTPPEDGPREIEVVSAPGHAAVGATRSMQLSTVESAALTRELQARSMAVKGDVAPAGIAGLGVATVLLLLAESILSLGISAQADALSLRNVTLAVVLGLTAFWWYGAGPRSLAPAAVCVLVALVLVADAVGLFGAPTGARVMDSLIAAIILLSSGLRLGGRRHPPAP